MRIRMCCMHALLPMALAPNKNAINRGDSLTLVISADIGGAFARSRQTVCELHAFLGALTG